MMLNHLTPGQQENHRLFRSGAESPVQRHYRDAKVMEIIEGTTQIQQILLGQFAVSGARSTPSLAL